MKRQTRTLLGLGIATIMLLGSASLAHAQYGAPPPAYGYPPPPPPSVRTYHSGLTLGAGLGFGAISADACGDACGAGFGYEFHIGGFLTPRLALLFDISGVAHPIPSTDVTAINTMYNAALQYWLTEAFWIKGGLGLAHYTETSAYVGDLGDDTGESVMVAGGFEIYQTGPFAIDLQLRLGESFYSVAKNHGSLAFLIGFNWY